MDGDVQVMSGKITSFKQLRVWQQGVEIVKDVYTLTRRFPQAEMYGLTAQMRRASVSIPSNIAEGFKRSHTREYKQFLHIALGSAAELETQLMIAKELQFINDAALNGILEKITYASKMLPVLVSRLH